MALALLRNFRPRRRPSGFALEHLLKQFVKQTGGAPAADERRHQGRPQGDEWRVLFVAGMWFQDLFNYDFRRTEMCIIPYGTQMGEISFCAYNTGVGWRQIVEKMHKNATVAEWYKTARQARGLRQPEEVGAAPERRTGGAEDPEGRPPRRLRAAAESGGVGLHRARHVVAARIRTAASSPPPVPAHERHG